VSAAGSGAALQHLISCSRRPVSATEKSTPAAIAPRRSGTFLQQGNRMYCLEHVASTCLYLEGTRSRLFRRVRAAPAHGARTKVDVSGGRAVRQGHLNPIRGLYLHLAPGRCIEFRLGRVFLGMFVIGRSGIVGGRSAWRWSDAHACDVLLATVQPLCMASAARSRSPTSCGLVQWRLSA